MQVDGRVQTDFQPRELIIGAANFRVLAINPSLKELKQLYDNDSLENEPDYFLKEGDKKVGIRIDFILQSDDPFFEDKPFITKASYFVKNNKRKNRDGTKTQVIDKKGTTAWLSKPADLANYDFVDSDARPALEGEEDFIKAFKTYLNVERGGACSFSKEDWEKIFKGDFSELQSFVGGTFENNKIKYHLVVNPVEKTNEAGETVIRYYQNVLTRYPMRSYQATNGEYGEKAVEAIEKMLEYMDENRRPIMNNVLPWELKIYDPTDNPSVLEEEADAGFSDDESTEWDD